MQSARRAERHQPRAVAIGAAVVRVRDAAAASDGLPLGVLDPRGPVGHADRTILIDSLAIMLAIVVPTIVATFAFAWWFRASNTRARYRPDWAYSGRIELVVWAIPALVDHPSRRRGLDRLA